MTTATDGGPHQPVQQAPFRRVAGLLIITVIVIVEVALGAAYVQLRRAADDIREIDSLSSAFTDVQRMFQQLELLAATEPRFDTSPVNDTLGLLGRQIEISAVRLEDPKTSPQLRSDIVDLRTRYVSLLELRDERPQDTEEALRLADSGQRAAQAAVDRTASVTRASLRADAQAATSTATVVAFLAGVVLVAGAALVWAVLRNYQRSFDESWAFAMSRERALLASNERLAEVAATRERFVSILSHELRSPLAVIGAAGDTLTAHWDRLDEDVRQRMLESLNRQVARQQRMIDDLLLVARHANADPEPNPKVVDVGSVFDLMREDERVAGTSAAYVAEGDLHTLVDPHHLEQVVRNLVRNAEKYGGDSITVTATSDHDWVVIRVEDDGEGVPASLQSVLFEPFTQAEENTRGGVGLGLSITRQLLEANGGRIEYRDRPLGGALFEIRLPRAEPSRADETASV